MADGTSEQIGVGAVPAQDARPAARFSIQPPAPPARPKGRHRFLFWSFVGLVLLPCALSAFYLWFRAADQFASAAAFSVRTEERSSAIELLGGIAELSGSSSSDTDILFAYLSSQELVRRIDRDLDLRAIWSRVPYRQDPLFALQPDGTIEDLLAHWDRKVQVIHDERTGLIDLRVLAFDATDAQRIARAVLAACAEKINQLTDIARQDAIEFTQRELEGALARLKEARRAVLDFRNRTQIVDPSIDTQNQMGLLVTLQQQLADALIEADLLADTTRANDPRITQARRRIDVIRARIAAERRNLGLGEEGESAEAFATLVGQYEGLVVDREFAESAYTAAMAAHDVALAEVRKQSRYLAAHVNPTRAERAEYPQRVKLLSLVTFVAFLLWAILSLVFYSFRDRR